MTDEEILYGPLPKYKVYPTSNYDIRNRVKNEDGSVSTVRTLSFNDGRGEVLIPTVVGDKILSDDDAIKYAQESGENFGIFETPEEADHMARFIHLLHQQRLAKENGY